MGESKLSVSRMLNMLGCTVFDIAVIIAFFSIFSLFSFVSPMKSILMLMVLLFGLFILNAAILFPNMLYKRIGIAYSTAIILLSVMYAVVANIFSIFLITGSITWYIFWELLIFAVFLCLYSVLAFFSKQKVVDAEKNEIEKVNKNLIMLKLMDIEALIAVKGHVGDMEPIVSSFKVLKERIHASTPFGRIVGKSAVMDIEDRINSNLTEIQSKIQLNNNLADVKCLLDDTKKLVIKREAINITN